MECPKGQGEADAQRSAMDLNREFCEGSGMDVKTPPPPVTPNPVPPPPVPPLHVSPKIEDGFFLGVVLVVSIAFALVIEPFFAAVLWGVIAAILFAPLNRQILSAIPKHRNGAALITLFLILGVVIVPAFVLGAALLQEGAYFYAKIQSGEINFVRLFGQVLAALPDWATPYLRRLGLTNFYAAQDMVTKGVTSSFRTLAAQAFQIGQSAFSFFVALGVMLYLTYFLLRDGELLSQRIAAAAPLRASQRQALIEQFVVVIRATIKGSIVVAIVQGLIGGIVFWALGIEGALLWGVLMGALSLLTPCVFPMVPITVSYFANVSRPLDLDAGRTLLPRFWPDLAAMLTEARALTERYRLTARDVAEIDWSIPIWDGVLGEYFVVNKISEFSAHRPTEVEIVRLHPTYLPPPAPAAGAEFYSSEFELAEFY